MTKREIADYIYEHLPEGETLTKREIYEIVNEVFQLIEGALINGNKVQITGFGTFQVKFRKKKVGRNPRTGEVVPVPDRKVIIFKPSRKLLERIEVVQKKS